MQGWVCAYSANPVALYSRKLTKDHELQPSMEPSASFFWGTQTVRTIADWQGHDHSQTTAECIIFFTGYPNCAHDHVRSPTDVGSRTITAERLLFGVTLTESDERQRRCLCKELLTPPQRIVTQIIQDFPGSRTGQWSINSTVPHVIFTCPGTSGPA